MRDSGRTHRQSRLHPIGGIGWVGILALLLLAVLLAIEVWSAHGVLYEFYRLLAENTSSTSNIALLAASALELIVLNLLYPSFGIWALGYLLAAFWLARRERRLVRFVAVPAWCFAETFIIYSPWSFELSSGIAGAFNSSISGYIPVAIAMVVHAWILWLATRSRRVPIIFLGIIVLAFLWDVLLPDRTRALNFGLLEAIGWRTIVIRGARTWFVPVSLLIIHVTMCGVMIDWALRDRRQPDLSTECGSCGYSRAGLMADVCPECGHKLQSAPSPIEQREMGEGGVRAT